MLILAVYFLPQSVVLAPRPPISIPLISVPPALLDELVSDLSSLASAYHKPAETFIGRGRLGADAVNKKATEYVSRFAPFVSLR